MEIQWIIQQERDPACDLLPAKGVRSDNREVAGSRRGCGGVIHHFLATSEVPRSDQAFH